MSNILVAESITISLPDIGDVLLERSYRAKHINISVKPPSKVRVAVPVGIKFHKAQRIAEQQKDWIRNQIRKFSNSKAKRLDKRPTGAELQHATAYLSERVKTLAQRYGFQYKKVSFKSMMTRWGSCSSKNNISLNILIAQLPKELQDYIILHELLHTRIKNHSKAYWAELDILIGNAKRIDSILKKDYVIYN